MTRYAISFAFIVFMVAGQPAGAENVSMEEAMAEMVMGSEDAPVTMIEYSSLSCPHCASFHREALPQIKKTYIDTGKVKLVYRDFPLESLAMAGSMIARCAGKKKFFGLVEVMFRSQKTWTRSDNPKKELVRIARFGGLSEFDVDACLKNEDLLKAIQARAKKGQKKFDIKSTPTFVINGEVVSGSLPFKKYQKVIDKALGENK